MVRRLSHRVSNISQQPELELYDLASQHSTPRNTNFILGHLAKSTSEDRSMSLYFQPALPAKALQETEKAAGISPSEVVYLGGTGHVCMTEDGTLITWSCIFGAPLTVSIAGSEITAVERITSKGRSARSKISTHNISIVVEIPGRARSELNCICMWETLNNIGASPKFLAAHHVPRTGASLRQLQPPARAFGDQASPLLKLPGELRNAIYNCVAEQIDHFDFCDGFATHCVCISTPEGGIRYTPHALSQASEQIRHGFLSLLEKEHLMSLPLKLKDLDLNFVDAISAMSAISHAALRPITIVSTFSTQEPAMSDNNLKQWFAFLLASGGRCEVDTTLLDGVRVVLDYRIRHSWSLCSPDFDECQELAEMLSDMENDNCNCLDLYCLIMHMEESVLLVHEDRLKKQHENRLPPRSLRVITHAPFPSTDEMVKAVEEGLKKSVWLRSNMSAQSGAMLSNNEYEAPKEASSKTIEETPRAIQTRKILPAVGTEGTPNEATPGLLQAQESLIIYSRIVDAQAEPGSQLEGLTLWGGRRHSAGGGHDLGAVSVEQEAKQHRFDGFDVQAMLEYVTDALSKVEL